MTTQETIKQAAAEAIDRINTIADQTTAAIAEFAPKRPNLDQPVEVAGIKWGGYLNPFEKCDAQSKFNEETGLYYFNQESAIMHAYHQNLRLPTKKQFQQLYDRTTLRVETIGELKYGVFTDKETGEELWMILGGWYDFDNNSFTAVGTHGFAWSSSVVDYHYGFYLGIHESLGVIPRSWGNRAFGFPVRCVLE